jgi:hypothetical protein
VAEEIIGRVVANLVDAVDDDSSPDRRGSPTSAASRATASSSEGKAASAEMKTGIGGPVLLAAAAK